MDKVGFVKGGMLCVGQLPSHAWFEAEMTRVSYAPRVQNI